MPKHPTNIEFTPGQIAMQVANLRYDKLREFLDELAVCLKADAAGDIAKQRSMLAGRLKNATKGLVVASAHIARAWEICKPHMKDEP